MYLYYLVVWPGSVIAGPVGWTAFTEDVGVREEITSESGELVDPGADRFEILGKCAESDLRLVDVVARVDVVEEVLVIGVLLVPLDVVVIAEVVAN